MAVPLPAANLSSHDSTPSDTPCRFPLCGLFRRYDLLQRYAQVGDLAEGPSDCLGLRLRPDPFDAHWVVVRDLFVGFIHKAAKIIGFLLLLYVGGSMILEGIKNDEEPRDLNGIRNIIIGAIATSIDALAVGVSMSLGQAGQDPLAVDHAIMVNTMIADHVAVFVVTMLSVFAGMFGGYRVGRRYGRPAEIIGGTVLIGIGIGVLLGYF